MKTQDSSVNRVASVLALLVFGLARSAYGADGYANVNGTTTGGTGTPVVVDTLAELNAAILDDVSRVVHVSGTINLGSSNVRFGSNKTIIGLGSNSGFIGNLKAVDENNVILQNLNFNNPNAVGDGDGLTLQGSTHIWVDNCSFVDCGDGSLDITHGCDWVTVSFCKFSYTFDSGHNFVNLIGHSDGNSGEDAGKLHVTFHHNWWTTGCVERMPRIRFGTIHSYNNYFNCAGNNYCVRASIQSQILVESCYFENIDTPYEKFDPPGLIRTVNNTTVNCTGVVNFNDSIFTPPYAYSPETPANARANVIANAGTGGGVVNPAPTVSITAPINGATFTAGANITVSANATDSNGTVTSVAFFANGSPIGTDTSSPYSISWNNVAAGTYALTAVATDNGGAQGTSQTVNIVVNPSGNPPPTVSITAPINGATFTAPANITVSANATDSNGTVTSVAFFANGSPIGTDTTSPYSIAWNNVAAGSYALTAVATDNGGAQGTSQTVNITVNPPGGGGTTVTFTSIGVEDGRILESSEGSNTGGSVDNTGSSSSALRTGDDSSDRQFKTILSFDTSSIPDGATITAATLRLRRGSASGTNPFGTHGSCFADIRGGTGFNNSVALQTTDFQAAADATQVATMSNAATDGALSSGTVNATGRGLINKTGKTQFRVYFSLDDNDDAGSDYVGWFSGNDATAGNRPTLEVTYQ
jgi:pectate lyase